MKWILLNDAIVKIFHDCRGDINALLYLLPNEDSDSIENNILGDVRNIFDTSIAHIVLNQLKNKQQAN